MKKIYTLFALFITLCSYAQSSFHPSYVVKEDFCSVPDIIAHSTFTNKYGVTDLQFVRIENTLSSQWTSAFCDCELCHDIGTDTANFYMEIDDSCEVSAHFYPVDKKGLGVMKIKIFNPEDPDKFVIGEFRATCWGASTTFLKENEFYVYPSPANDIITIQFGSGEDYQLEIVSVDGKVFMDEQVSGLNHPLDISQLETGMYVAKVTSAGKVYYSRFSKL
ncbi:MAG: T9SS type A sorting domain-containing protein [Flavobacteriales bacterium]|nr:T9SS type A sorting domain-containing protein [Flavobacteriales bacterium]